MSTETNLTVKSGGKIVIGLVAIFFLSGCGDFFDEKTTFIRSQRIRDDIRQIRPVIDPNTSLPSIYRSPPKIVEQVVNGTGEFKLSYFCKHHISDKLAIIVKEQFATKLFDKKGKSTSEPDYTISSNLATNQLIVRCPGRKDVDAVLETLEMIDVPPVQVKIDCLISELYADDTLDWETTIQIGDLLGEDITAGGSARLFGADVLELVQERVPLPAFPGASLREVARAKMGLKVGYSSAEHNFLAVVDILESRGYLKVLMNPTLEIVNGRTARIISSEHVPLEKIFLHDREGFIETKTEYVDVIDSLEITPHVFADGYIGLETTATIGSKSIPDGVKQIRIVSKREIYNQENRIRPGESLVIGGIRKSEEHAVVRGVPFLKDIPLLGILFSSKDYEDRAVETMFILTPTISSGGIPNREMVEELRRKHEMIDYSSGLQNTLLDPFDLENREKEYALKLQKLEQKHLETAGERETSRRKLREAQSETKRSATEAQEAKKREAEAKRLAAEEKKKAQEAVTQTEKAKTEIEKLKAEVQKAKDDAKKSKEEARRIKAEAAKAEDRRIKTEAMKAEVRKIKAKADDKKARAEAEKKEETIQEEKGLGMRIRGGFFLNARNRVNLHMQYRIETEWRGVSC